MRDVKEMLSLEVVVERVYFDNAAGARYEATCSLYPELLAIEDTDEAAFDSLRTAIKRHTRANTHGHTTLH